MSVTAIGPDQPPSGSMVPLAGSAPVAIRRLPPGNAIRDALVDLHRESLADDVLPALGSSFLRRYFESALTDASQHVIGAFVSEELVGFCQLSLLPVRIGALLRSKPEAMLPIIRVALFRPGVFRRGLLLAVRQRSRAPGPEISLLAVKALQQRRGIGKQLVRRAMAVAAQSGFDRISTKTANASARAMYERNFGASITDAYCVARHQYWCLSWDCGILETPNAEHP